MSPASPTNPVAVLGAGCLIMILAIVAIATCIHLLPVSEESRATLQLDKQFGSKVEAWTYAEEFVKRRLKSPGSAEFGFPDHYVLDPESGIHTVSGYCDSQNAFGALMRLDYVCQLKREGDGWRCISLDVRQR